MSNGLRSKYMAKPKWEEWTKETGLILIEGWARDGLTEEQIAHNMGIRRETLWEWKKRYPNIANTINKSKEVVDRMVENALLKRALGYSYEETRVEIMPDGSKKGIQVTKTVVPDVKAQEFWLRNRKPDAWRAKPIETITEEMADDGLFDALAKSLQAKMQDDSDMLPKEDAE